ncbi:DUF4397 domain-containing protein [Pedobacter jejuensis]|uniref:DUF4397 domain-containing protein n=1 Tax=Pedobacter jejuensis TaxID=1268550 RepID=A0A3N0BYY1_9SPHI|nr:DUF4397 domain-containing protein [Pedobacter jejuensis]RNL55147.1 DUF4397 domain-containing protein [Pedobacter jejuensis]
MQKSTNSFFRKSNFYSLAILLMVAIISSCGKTDAIDTTISYLRVVNSSPGLATYNVYLNGSAINSASLPFAGALAYTSKTAGTYSLKFTSGSNTESLLTKDVALNQNTRYSYYLINKPGQLDGLLIGDDLSMPATDKAYIRFINLSPDAPALDLFKTSTTTSYATNKAFKAASGFIAVDAGTYSLDAKDTTTGSVKTTITDAVFVAGYHYDVICGGLVNPANDTERPIGLHVLTIK